MNWTDFSDVVKTCSLAIIAISVFAMMMSQVKQPAPVQQVPVPSPTMYQTYPDLPVPVYEVVPQPKEIII